jgi:adenosine deaminase
VRPPSVLPRDIAWKACPWSHGRVPALTYELLHQLPKTDLHVHLDGSLRLDTLVELARAQGVSLPAETPDGLSTAMRLGERVGTLVEYLRAFDVTLSVLQTREALQRVAFELAEDAAAENVRYMEVRYSPMLHTRAGLHHVDVVEAVLRGLEDAATVHGIESKIIICGIRNISPEASLEMAELTVAYKDRGVVGFDLAGAEYDHPAADHQAAFDLVRSNNINVTIHAGEAYGAASVAQALHTCGAHRIGHGCRLREDGDLLHYVIDHRIPLEVCPSSNVQTGAVESLERHPVKLYADLGARVTINTDNRMVTNTSVTKELWLLHERMGFDLDRIQRVIVGGFKSAFMPFHRRSELLRRVTAELAALTGGPLPSRVTAEASPADDV